MAEGIRPQERFTHLVADYRRYRPDYPVAALEHLRGLFAPDTTPAAADLGSGTGIFTRQLLAAGFAPVFAVEPNDAMRATADKELAAHPGFVSCRASAEATGLEAASVDLAAAAQAFHWFEPEACRTEFRRILRPGGQAALLWNNRESVEHPFSDEYEAITTRYAKDLDALDHRGRGDRGMRLFWPDAIPAPVAFPHAQMLDRDGLHGRIASTSYAPRAGESGHDELHRELDALFDAHQRDGIVMMEYVCRLYCGVL